MTVPVQKASDSLAYKGRILWLFIKYQLLTKTLLVLVIYPVYSLILNSLLHQSGRTVFSSGDFKSFLLSFNGIGLIAITLLVMMMLIALDINSFILISALIKEGKIEMTARHMVWVGLKSLKQFLSPLGLITMLYISLIFPIIGFGITVSPMKNFQIPNFITSVIYANPLYLSLYGLVILMLTYISYRLLFVLHYVLIQGYQTRQALTASLALTKIYGRRLLKDLVVETLKTFGKLYIPIGILFAVLAFLLMQLAETTTDVRFFLFLILLGLAELVALATFMFTPLLLLTITKLFYRYNAEQGTPVQLVTSTKATAWLDDIPHKIKWRSKLLLGIALLLVTALNIGLSTLFTVYFDDIFKQDKSIEIIAHRAGGDLGAENTVEGILEAAKEGVSWAEIDVQRTKDGAYILNHDGDFSRVAGESRTSSEMTLDEIKTLKVSNLFDSSKAAQPVPTMNEVVAAAKGKIGLFIELKGKTADTKMVDDMVKLIKAEQIENEAVLLSLDYNIITYIEETYPEVQSGYLYYFAVGQTEDLLGDYLIMEEREATPEKVALLKSSGKKVVVWTVNTDESIKTFVNSDVDGIITDYVLAVKDGMMNKQKRSDWEIIIDGLLG